MSHLILVTGAAGGAQGSTGRLITGLLLEQGVTVRALVHKLNSRSDELRQQGARSGTVGLAPTRKRRSQPDAVDHRGDHRGEALRLLRRHELLQRGLQVRERAALIDRLHAPQTLDL